MGVTVVGEGFTGTYDYVVVEATDAHALTDWAAGAGWSLASVQARSAAVAMAASRRAMVPWKPHSALRVGRVVVLIGALPRRF